MRSQVPKTCQLVLFSATFPDNVREFAARLAPQANEIRLKREELNVDLIKQFYMDCKDEAHKYEVLVELYNLLTIGQSIIFCAKRETADTIARRMTAEGHKVDSLHGKLDTTERDRTIDAFRDGKSKVLIATNVIARGIDIMQVTMVVNYDMPVKQSGQPDAETYLHRIGEYRGKWTRHCSRTYHGELISPPFISSPPFGKAARDDSDAKESPSTWSTTVPHGS